MNFPKLSNTAINQTRHLVTSLLVGLLLLSGCQPSDSLYIDEQNNSQFNSDTNACQNDTIISAFKAQQSDRQVKGCGTVIKVLPDDNEGSRHQKYWSSLMVSAPSRPCYWYTILT